MVQASIKFSTITGDFYALLLSDKLYLQNNLTLFGAVTTNELNIHTNNATIVGQSQCINPPIEEVARIEIKPSITT
ncbi:hypothetical protein [Vibrio taketomensis]|uniref:hypothetical protein n=1 Tax=Vibrio taketomensis TaxID=2572923 RepID=UPI001389415C|nr:hypothetical protein [Vibrio taketomensis]